MAKEYGQFCGVARALEIVGGRWTLLIVRDLLIGPKRFSELEEGLPGIPTNILSSRLRELEEAGVIQRTLLARPANSVAYELTVYGYELDGAVARLGLWGAKSLGPPKSGDYFNTASLAIAIRGAFNPANAQGRDLLFELRLNGRPLNVFVSNGEVSFPTEQATKPHVTLDCGPSVLAELLGGSTSIDSALASGLIKITGSRRSAKRFFDIFRFAS